MKTPFHLLLIRTYHAQKNRLRPEMAGIGLSPGQPKILNRLMEKDCCMQKELAESCDIQPATVSRMLDTMEQAGLVCRQEEAPRRRAASVAITEAGREAHRQWQAICGRVGEVDPITVPELARKAQAVLGGRCNRPRSGPAVQVKFADTGRTVKRLAVISGAGGSMFEDALAVGADCLLTGEANHHAAIDAVRLGLSLVAAGHYATEFPVCAAIADRLHAAFPELEVRVSGENRDPFTYI